MFESTKNQFNADVEQKKSQAAAVGRCFVAGLKAGAFFGGVVLAVGVPYAIIKRLGNSN